VLNNLKKLGGLNEKWEDLNAKRDVVFQT